jgi:transposase-like protein
MKFCPRCGSKNINWLIPYDMQKYECKDCGWTRAFIIEDGIIAEELKKDYLKNKKEE